jgi:predicted N-acetyltransferase YhbS
MEIRFLSSNDNEIKQVATWIYNEWGYVNPDNSVVKIANQISLRSNSKSVPLTLVAIETEIVGTVSLVENEFKSRPELTPFLGSLYVPPEYRQSGIGDALCHKVLEEVKKLGYSKCYLVTDKKSEFYAKRGWETILEYSYRDSSAFLMEIAL